MKLQELWTELLGPLLKSGLAEVANPGPVLVEIKWSKEQLLKNFQKKVCLFFSI